MLKFLRLALGVFFILLVACGTPLQMPGPGPDKVDIVHLNPGEDPACTCSESRGVQLRSRDTLNFRYVKTEVKVKLPNQPVTSFYRNDPLAPEETKSIGCTIAPIGEPATCLQINTYTKISESSMKSSSSAPNGSVISSPYFINDIQSCISLCAVGSSCYTMGHAAAPLILPFLPLLDAAEEKNESIISKSDILNAYGLKPSDDRCNRSDIEVTAINVRNSGSIPSCIIALNDYAAVNLPDDIVVEVPKDLQGTKIDLSKIAGLSSKRSSNGALEFEELALAPKIRFVGPNSAELSDLYGGSVRYMTRYENDVILSNTNGCMSIRLK